MGANAHVSVKQLGIYENRWLYVTRIIVFVTIEHSDRSVYVSTSSNIETNIKLLHNII